MKKNGQNHAGMFQAACKAVTTIVAFSGASCFAASDNGAPITITDLTVNGPVIATEFSGDKTKHEQLANFAWREFIALNSPAGSLPANRGKPDQKRNFVASGKPNFYSSGKTTSNLGTNLLVWQTFAHRSELFPVYSTPPAKPSPFAKVPDYVFGVPPTFGKGVLKLYNNLDEVSQIGQNLLFFPKNPPTPASSPYADTQVLFEAKVNQTEYDYGQTLGANDAVTLPDNSVEVKAAWRLMTPNVDATRYHTAQAVYYTGTDAAPVARNGTFGLVGLHIIQKTKNFPTFIFASFEQVDALKLPNGKASGLYYISNYNSLAYDPNTPTQPVAVINNGSSKLVSVALPAANPNLPAAAGVPAGFAGPVTVVQPDAITKQVQDVNYNVYSLLASSPLFKDSVWKYYKLKGVQAIPSNEQGIGQSPSPDTLDFYLANIVIESSQPGIQLFKGGPIGPGDNSFALKPTDLLANRATDSIPFPATKPADCGDFEQIDWPAAGQSVAVPRGYPAASYQPKAGFPGALFAGVFPTYQWGGTKCGGTCSNNDSKNPICFTGPNATNVTLPDSSKVNMGGCMGCHGQAQQAQQDFSFLFFSKGGTGFNVDVVGGATSKTILPRTHQYQFLNRFVKKDK
jgi:hypothetical protein